MVRKRHVSKVALTILSSGVLSSGWSPSVLAQSSHQQQHFMDASRAFGKAITALNHEPNVSQTGFSANLKHQSLSVIFALRTVSVTVTQVNTMVQTYIQSARSFDQDAPLGQLFTPFTFHVTVYQGDLSGHRLFTGVKSPGSNIIAWKKDGIILANPEPKSTPIHNLVLAQSTIPKYQGWQLELVDVQGHFVNNSVAGPFQGTNWTGHFQLRVINGAGKVLHWLALPDNRFTQFLFTRKFHFHFADYNGDGYPDFTLGQYLDNNGYTYQLFEVTPHGITELRMVPRPLFASDLSYSPLFQRGRPNAFSVKYYDNTANQAGWYRATYRWENGKFVQVRDQKVSTR